MLKRENFGINFVMMRTLFFTLLLSSLPLLAEESLVVHLNTADSLKSLYLAPLSQKGSAFSQNYLSKLEKILHFDLDNNGATSVVKTQKADFQVNGVLHQRQLAFSLSDRLKGRLHSLEGIELSGELSKDRRKMHQVADAIHKALFGKVGIAQTRVLYTVRTRNSIDATKWISEVWEADYDGGNPRQVTRTRSLCVTPTYIPAPRGRSQHFLYVGYENGQPKIYGSSLSEGVGRRLTYLRGNQLMPVISPKKDKIAFISDITGNPDLFVQKFSLDEGVIGKPQQVFCAPGATQGTPTFSPDGRKLAFVSNKDGTPRIYVLEIPPPGTSLKRIKPTLISKRNRGNTCPAWSPDGKKIAYSAMTHGARQIWIYDMETRQETQLTDGSEHKENPAWAPNSLHLMFNASTPTQSDLYLINLKQKKGVKLTQQGVGEKRFPAWEPTGKG